MFNSSNFLESYDLTDVGLIFKDTLNRRVQGMNVCKYNDLGIEANIIWVLLEGDEKIVLDFANATDANSALTILKKALDQLTPNCELGATPPPPAASLNILEVTVDEYKTLASDSECTETLIADLVQWYDVTDVSGVFGEGAGSVYRVLALHPNDTLPHGFNITTKKWCITDFVGNKLEFAFLNNGLHTTINNSKIIGGGENIFVCNKSTIDVEKSEYIIAENSTANIRSCTRIFLRNCNELKIEKSEFCHLDGIIGDYSGYIFSNVTIDKSDTIGKNGYETISKSEPLIAYIQLINQQLDTGVSGEYRLQNIFTDSNAEFNFIVPANYVGELKVKDWYSASLLFVIQPQHSGLTITFKYDKNVGRFYLHIPYSLGEKSDYSKVTIASNGQTAFANALNFIPTNPTKSRMFLNGQKQHYGVDYTIANKDITWVDVAYSLETDDVLEIYYE